MKSERSKQILEKYYNIKFHENPSVKAQFFNSNRQADGRIDRQT
jgi:hemoglobin-like flavoprotein